MLTDAGITPDDLGLEAATQAKYWITYEIKMFRNKAEASLIDKQALLCRFAI